MIETRYHDRVNVLHGLLEGSSANNPLAPTSHAPFDRPEWYELVSKTGLSPLIAIASAPSDSAVLALTESEGRISSLRNWYAFTWRPHITQSGAGYALLCELAEQLKNRAHRITLEPIPDEDGSASRLARAFADAGWRVELTQCDTNHFLTVKGRSFQEYWATRPGRLRTTLKRKASKVETRILDQFDAETWQSFEDIYNASWKPEEDHPEMLRAFAEQEGAARRLRLGLAFQDEKAVAAQFWTVENGVAYIHKLAHLKSAQKLSAGTTLSAALFEHTIDTDKVEEINFGTGTQSYKADWMENTRPRFMVDCFKISSPRGLADLARLTARRLMLEDPPALAPIPPRR